MPGTYVFHLRARKRGNIDWVYLDHPLVFMIKPAFWQTSFFKVFIALLSIALLYYLIQNALEKRMHKKVMELEKRNAAEEERSRIGSDLHDDLGSGLTRIKFISDNILEEYKSGNEIASELNKLSIASEGLVESMSEIIWAMNERNNQLRDTLYHLRSYAAKYCEENKLQCIINLADTIIDTEVSGQFRRNLYLIVKESLHNIVKHAHATQVNISMLVDEKLTIIIQDNGSGIFDELNRTTGNGILNMKKRCKELGGSLVIMTNNGIGLKFQIPLP
jgi:signal transduction histidine kinase